MKSPDELAFYPKNARKHPKNQIDKIAESIRQFGFNTPILIDSKNVVLAGNGRLEAAKQLKLDSIPTVKIDHLDEQQQKAFILADNRLAELAHWDEELLEQELSFIHEAEPDFEFGSIGFEDFAKNSIEKDDDFIDELDNSEIDKTETFIKLGDIITLGKHLLLCGDCTDDNNCNRLMNGEIADMVFTDPPYQLQCSDFLCNATKKYCSSNLLLMCTMKQAFDVLAQQKLSFKFDAVFYFKTPSSMLNKKVPYYCHKTVAYFGDETKTIFNCDNAAGVFSDKGFYPSVIESKKNMQENRMHGLAKPADDIIKLLSGFNAKIVVDFFAGSGSTLIACEQTGRCCRMIEIDEHYCQVIIDRYINFTTRDDVTIERHGKTYQYSELKK